MTLSEHLKQAYIEPIRSVMLVDENFVTLAGAMEFLAESEAGQPQQRSRLEVDAEVGLWNASRARKWLCDIVTSPKVDVTDLGKADLIVLDYHLVGGDSTTDSIRIIQELSRSPRANIVIVYTNEDGLAEAKRKIASHLSGVESDLGGDVDEFIDAHRDDFEEALQEAALDHYIAERSMHETMEGFRAERNLEDEQVLHLFENSLLERYFSAEAPPTGRDPGRPVRLSKAGSQSIWVQCGNVFVALVSKKVCKGEQVFKALEDAIADWDPPLLVAGLARARHFLVEGGFSLDSDFLTRNRPLHIGLLAHALGGNAIPSTRSIRDLFARVLSHVKEDILEQLVPWVAEELGQDPATHAITRAAQLAKEPDGASAENDGICLALNVFLCSEDPKRVGARGHVTTGTVFRCNGCTDVSSDRCYWVCVTPSCDMEIRRGDPDPRESDLRTITALRLTRVDKLSNDEKNRSQDETARALKSATKIKKALKRATDCRHVFVKDDGEELVLAVGNRADTMHALKLAAVESDTGIPDGLGTFRALVYRDRPVECTCEMGKVAIVDDRMALPREPRTLRVIGQLRESYASRLLQEAGGYRARIGVDFVNPLKK